MLRTLKSLLPTRALLSSLTKKNQVSQQGFVLSPSESPHSPWLAVPEREITQAVHMNEIFQSTEMELFNTPPLIIPIIVTQARTPSSTELSAG